MLLQQPRFGFTLRLCKFSDFCSRHTVGVAGHDIMFHILVSTTCSCMFLSKRHYLIFIFFQPDYINSLAGLVAAENLALNKSVYASSAFYSFPESNVNDGDQTTAFVTQDIPWSFVAVDLGNRYEVNAISHKVSDRMRKYGWIWYIKGRTKRKYISFNDCSITASLCLSQLWQFVRKYFSRQFFLEVFFKSKFFIPSANHVLFLWKLTWMQYTLNHH